MDNVTLTDDLEIAGSLNSYFLTLFTLENYENFPEYSILWFLSCQLSFVIQMRSLTSWEILIHSSPGPDHLSTRVLKECAIEIASPFCSFLNRSFSAGEVPYAWKIANVVLIHKKGRKDYRENDRQSSLTSVACKVTEKIVKDRVVNFWQDLNVFNPNQFGFLEGKSTLSQLLCCFDDWASSHEINQDPPTLYF